MFTMRILSVFMLILWPITATTYAISYMHHSYIWHWLISGSHQWLLLAKVGLLVPQVGMATNHN